MKLMKKFCLLIVLAICISLVGCGASNEDNTDGNVVQIDYSSAVVSYLGPEGTYTQEACQKFFDEQGTYVPYETVDDAVTALVDGKSEYAVIPQENTIGGPVTDYIDIVIARPEVTVVGEVELPISQNLLVRPGTQLGDIKKVYSHKQGILQGKDWLDENLPGVEIEEVSSTAEGAKLVSEGKDNSCAAICSVGCADVYGLEVLAESIQNNDSNKTRFYVLSTKDASTADSDRMAFVATGDATYLPDLMADIKAEDMTLVTVHDRPEKTELGQYNYLVECTGGDYKDYEKLTKDSKLSFRYLGSFSVK